MKKEPIQGERLGSPPQRSRQFFFTEIPSSRGDVTEHINDLKTLNQTRFRQDRKEIKSGIDPTLGWMANSKQLIPGVVATGPLLPHRQPSPFLVLATQGFFLRKSTD